MGTPQDHQVLERRLGGYHVTEMQLAYFHGLLEQNLRFCRLGGAGSPAPSGRGLASFRDFASRL